MATITARSIVDKAEIILQDTTNTRWPEEELLGWLNDGQREVVLHKPAANPVNVNVQLVGGTLQSIGSDGLRLIDVIRNMGTVGATQAGKAIRIIDRRILDTQRPEWHTESQTEQIRHFCFDDRDPRTFFVYPPVQENRQVEVVYSAAPGDIEIDDTISIDDIYANSLLDYILYRAYAKDTDYTTNDNRVSFAYESFLGNMGLLEQRAMVDNPNYRTLSNISPSYLGPGTGRQQG